MNLYMNLFDLPIKSLNTPPSSQDRAQNSYTATMSFDNKQTLVNYVNKCTCS